MEIRSVIGAFSDDVVIERKQTVYFNTFDSTEYEELFQKLSENNYILNGNFSDSQWSLSEGISDYPIVISFDLDLYPSLNKALRAYTVVRIISGRNPLTVYNELATLKEIIFESNGFQDTRKFETFLIRCCNNFVYKGYRVAKDTERFLSFYEVKNKQLIIDICKKVGSYSGTNRDLPPFEDIMIFDDAMNDYFQSYPTEQTIEYLPILMWWLITNILPLRPSEFLMLGKDCVQYREHQNFKYGIKVPRIKQRSDTPEFITKYDFVEIDERTYNLINQSIKKIELLGIDSPYLFPIQLLTHFRIQKRDKKNNRVNRRDFDFLKKEFYENVVEKLYGHYGLERVKSGDTRHFAIINMCLQGFNMLSIARMAGHEEIDSQYGYYAHAEHFAQSYVYRLAQKKLEHSKSQSISGSIIGWKRYVYDKGKAISVTDRENIVGRIQYGTCIENQDVFPNNCIEFCEYCPNFIFNPVINEREQALQWLADSSKVLEVKIRESIELMKEISTSLANSLRNANNDVLKTTSRQLLSYMDLKATIDSKLMEELAHGQKKQR
ncbi:site-specific integrase [Brevibacillus centrosporus]|jgi:hypothetical protein|uniref:site-specific integrase n=2 Tax=Brevibacillus centrosporus TaxID=54910 RepID=UPI000F09FEBF|nr:site-specific integrase [Brevibacillus centrosporus]MEC2127598.1 site-specific integrase [Brevibacillus centrosporus]MED4910578.1 site-specific integrase [Brevibacillus centrosporus]RNB68083.1 site-specific integrase [Brevibacillus centrosporus]GED30248.1 hypothetical protein BCE02nite_13890 [Brevibacillus centrosporus]